ncbi:iron transporter [Halopiger djelfimassiliensis]|uniref:iron transporter n=1 Tax=Halopiger djelfimassiliensis TaxID=1293047 RepID=UPI00067828F0|nr:iron transporter [Halopiger djelfimassiliensis]
MRRRETLVAGGSLLAPLSGCLETLRREDAWRELVVDPPERVYVPPKIDETMPYGTATANGLEISISATRPHSFWTVTGRERSRADVRSNHAIHLMAAVRDAATGVVVPTTVATTIRNATGRVDERTLWPMLSQRMGFHYGDNASLEGAGSYEATVRVGPPGPATAGGVGDRLGRATTVSIEFDHDPKAIDGLGRTLIDEDEGRGDPDALEPMDPVAARAARFGLEGARDDAIPGERLGVASSGDVSFPVRAVGGARHARGRDGEQTLAVAPRTAYNRFPLPFAALSLSLLRDGDVIRAVRGRETIAPELGHHYAAVVAASDLERAETLRIAVETPPQVARHEGYETAFLEVDPATVPVS